jgi:hypothetical protein
MEACGKEETAINESRWWFLCFCAGFRPRGGFAVAGEDYLLINHGLSSLLNAVGAFFGVLFLAQRKG